MIQCWSSHDFAGKVNWPEKVAPAANSMVSPQLALFSAVCKLPPEGTWIVEPVAGVSVVAVCKYVRGNSAGPSKPAVGVGVFGVDVAATEKEKLWLAVLFDASITFATKENWPLCVVEPLSCPPLLKLKPEGSEPDATDH